MNQPPNMEQVSVKISDTTPHICECGCQVFSHGMLIKTVSAIVSKTGKEQTVLAPSLYCLKCFKPFAPTQDQSLIVQ